MGICGGFDGHVHTMDGSMESVPIEEVISLSLDAGLDAIAITDHNSVRAIDRAKELSNGLEIVPGIELDAMWGEWKVHMICYFPDYKRPGFGRDLYSLSSGRRARIPETIMKLGDLKLVPPDDIDLLIGYIKRNSVYTANAVADALIFRYNGTDTAFGRELQRLESIKDYVTPKGRKKGDIDLLSKVLHEYIGKEGSAYVPYDSKRFPSVRAVGDFSDKYDGALGYAHIYPDLVERERVEKALEDGVKAGTVVVGVDHPRHDVEQQEHLLGLVMDMPVMFRGRCVRMIPVNGSDFHAIPGMPSIGDIRSPISTLYRLKEIIC